MTTPSEQTDSGADVTEGTPPAVAPTHSTGDPILSALVTGDGVVASIVSQYPGREGIGTSPDWLERWFTERALGIFKGEAVPQVAEVPFQELAASTAEERPRELKIRQVLSIYPQWFRGFRRPAEAIALNFGLVLIDGRNSTGKTSLAEALEWLFKGELSRRTMGENGNARELEACVGNHFRPLGEQTFVEAVFRLEDDTTLVLRRVLDEDYGPTSTSKCRSRLFRDDVELSHNEEVRLLDDLFGGSPPLLMQHTLRQFVHSSPADRRGYFERLLRLDELAGLIEKAVLGAHRIAELRRPNDVGAIAAWRAFKSTLGSGAQGPFSRVERLPLGEIADAIRDAMDKHARKEFDVEIAGLTHAEVRARVEAQQSAARQRQFPLLTKLRPTRKVDAALLSVFQPTELETRVEALKLAVQGREQALLSAQAITDAQLAIAGAMAALTDAQLLPTEPFQDLSCPVCEYQATPTLTVTRMAAVRAWQPIHGALKEAEARVESTVKRLKEHLTALYREKRGAVPVQPTAKEWENAVGGVDAYAEQAVGVFRTRVEERQTKLVEFEDAVVALGQLLPDVTNGTTAWGEVDSAVGHCIALLADVSNGMQVYAEALTGLEQNLGNLSGSDEGYRARNGWLQIADSAENIAEDLRWEQAKSAMATVLEQARTELKTVRQLVLDRRRDGFNQGISEIWSTLRGDTYSVFSQLHIPEPRGKGYKVEIEVKARLDDGTKQEDVDALRVFSESQVHALGIGAFVTRAKMLEHRVLIFDDPVQSMDEEHFRTFAFDLLSHLLDEGFQVVVLTHNDTFARDLSTAHHKRDDFSSLKITFSREEGTGVDVGQRRLRERLTKVDGALKRGDFDAGWLELRLGIERLLTVLRADHHDCGVSEAKWRSLTAGQMFSIGVGEIIRTKAPKLADQLKDTIDLASAGAHDTPTRGQTDLAKGLALVRKIATQFGLKD